MTTEINSEAPEFINKTLPPEGYSDLVIMRGLKATPKTSGSKRPMLQYECEIVLPKTVRGVDKKLYELAGNKHTYYLMLDEEGKYGAEFIKNVLLPKLGIDNESLDVENSDWLAQFEGIYFEAMVSTADNVKTKLDPDTGKYVPVKNSKGQPVIFGTKLNAFVNEISERVDEPEGLNTPF